MAYQHRIENSEGHKLVMGQYGRGRGKKSNARKQPQLPPSGKVVPEIEDRSKSTSQSASLSEDSIGNVSEDELVISAKSDEKRPMDEARTPSFAKDSAEKSDSNQHSSGSLPEVKSFDNSNNLFSPPCLSPSDNPTDKLETDAKATEDVSASSLGFRSISWTQVTGSYRRERSIEGLLVGSAVGDALGVARGGLTRRSALSMFGREPLEYRLMPGFGIVSDDSHRMLMTMQALLRSRSQLDHFRNNFAWRLRWYLLTIPVSSGRASWLAALRLWMGVSPEGSGVPSPGNAPLVSALALATVLQGTGHSVERWVMASTKVTHNTPSVSEAAILIAHAAHMALMTPKGDFNSRQVMDDLIALTEETSLNTLLSNLREPLSKRYTVHRAAKQIGYGAGIPRLADATAVMAVYAWLRHPGSYRRAVTAAIRAGGDSDSLGAIVGGFAGIHLGVDSIPRHWVKRVFTWPQSRRWLEKMTGRLTDWPHGSEDLHKANGLPVYPIRQLMRSAMLLFAVGLAFCVRLPWQIMSWMERK